MTRADVTAIFEARRRHLFGLAYRILGSRADAEDAVQDTFIKWQAADHAGIDTPAAWLTTLCTRHCIDMLRDAQRSRVDQGLFTPIFRRCVVSQKGREQGAKRRWGRPHQGFATPRTAFLITTRRERGENSATLRCTSRQGMSLAVVARLDWHCFHRVRTPENSGEQAQTGTWLPEPIQTRTDETPETHALLASSLGTAFLLLLERLTPKERAAYLLREIFDTPYAEVASTLGIEEAACRKLVSRAQASVAQARVRHVTPPKVQDGLLSAFRDAITGGGTGALAGLLAEDIALCADSGGKVTSIEGVIHGKASVLALIADQLAGYWANYDWLPCEINGGRAIQLRAKDGETVAAITFAYNALGQASNIFIMRNPDKLDGLAFGPEAVA